MIAPTHNFAPIFTDYGHPDENDGVSPLPGTDRTLRLMHSGENSRGGRLGTVLVKEEWDAAEKWLKQEEDEGRLPQ